jgi:hypothetical protein
MVELIKGLIQQGLDEEGQFIVVWWLWYNLKPCKVVVFILLMPNKSLFIGFCFTHIGEYSFYELWNEHIKISKHCFLECQCIIFVWDVISKWFGSNGVLPPILSFLGNNIFMKEYSLY